jgi:thiamine-phosphate diphosphorylase
VLSSRLYLITDRIEPVAAAIEGGVDLVQLRNKALDDEAFAALAARMSALCRGRGVPFVINDRVHLVEVTGADGAHVGEDDLAPEEARRILGPGRLLGVSTHDRAELAAAAGRGADYAGLGPMFPTATKTLSRTSGGADLVRSTLGATDLPVFCIGGIGPDNVGELVRAGATRVAVSSAITEAADPAAAARRLITQL